MIYKIFHKLCLPSVPKPNLMSVLLKTDQVTMLYLGKMLCFFLGRRIFFLQSENFSVKIEKVKKKSGNVFSVKCWVLTTGSVKSYLFTPHPLRAVGVLFSPMVSGWAGGRGEKVCPGCISETVGCRKLILGRDIS